MRGHRGNCLRAVRCVCQATNIRSMNATLDTPVWRTSKRARVPKLSRLLESEAYGCPVAKEYNEIRDPVHVFVDADPDELAVINCRAFQRLRHIHQLALTYLVYPGATHKRFEHSLGVMELAGRAFDAITN